MNGTNKQDDTKESPSATYRQIPEKEMEDEAVNRPKSAIKIKSKEFDGADEKMLPRDESKVSPNSEISLKDVKIVMGEKNGDAKLEMVETKGTFGGMTKEELMKYANDPFWVRLRWFLFITFWLLWAAMLIGAIMIIYAAPKCDPPPPRTWWQVGPLASLKYDATPEEVKAITKDIKGVIVSFNEDPYKAVDDSHKVIQLIKSVKESGTTKIIIELDPSTSDVWFKESEANNANFTDYYIWHQPKYDNNQKPGLPNNWGYVMNDVTNEVTSFWNYSEVRKEYYYAPLTRPHLNFYNDKVIAEFSKVVKKFLDSGASGISIRNARTLLVDRSFADEKQPASKEGVYLAERGFFLSTATVNNEGLGKLLLNWKWVVTNKTEDGLLMVSDELGKVKSYQVNHTLIVDLPLLTNVFTKPDVSKIVEKLNHTFKIDRVQWPLWRENSSSLPTDVVSIVTGLLPGVSLVSSSNATIDQRLLKLRESPSIMRGSCEMYAVGNNTVFAYIREIVGYPGVLVALNTGEKQVTLNVKQDIPPLSGLDEVTIQYFSSNYNETGFTDVNIKKDATQIPLTPKSVLVLQYVPKKKTE